ncbi:hypothetical protein Drorol1_Dr00005623 [Drosera rotundifolia]
MLIILLCLLSHSFPLVHSSSFSPPPIRVYWSLHLHLHRPRCHISHISTRSTTSIAAASLNRTSTELNWGVGGKIEQLFEREKKAIHFSVTNGSIPSSTGTQYISPSPNPVDDGITWFIHSCFL